MTKTDMLLVCDPLGLLGIVDEKRITDGGDRVQYSAVHLLRDGLTILCEYGYCRVS